MTTENLTHTIVELAPDGTPIRNVEEFTDHGLALKECGLMSAHYPDRIFEIVSEASIRRFRHADGRTIVAKKATHHTGAVGWYGCDENTYQRAGDFSCGARYYFDDDLGLLTPIEASP